jgi:hypothetical protein
MLVHELRRAEIEMGVDAVLIVGVGIFEIIGDAEHCRELASGLRVEIGVAGAAVDRRMPDSDIGEPVRIVGSDRDIARQIGHVVVDAVIPLQGRLREDVSEGGQRFAALAGDDAAARSLERHIDGGLVAPIDPKSAQAELAAEDGRGEGIARAERDEVAAAGEAEMHRAAA